jgi:hypothetical protein
MSSIPGDGEYALWRCALVAAHVATASLAAGQAIDVLRAWSARGQARAEGARRAAEVAAAGLAKNLDARAAERERCRGPALSGPVHVVAEIAVSAPLKNRSASSEPTCVTNSAAKFRMS